MLVMDVMLGIGRLQGQTGMVLWALALLCSVCVQAPAHSQSFNDCAQVIYRNDVPGSCTPTGGVAVGTAPDEAMAVSWCCMAEPPSAG